MEPIYPYDDVHEDYDEHCSNAVNNGRDQEEAYKDNPPKADLTQIRLTAVAI